MSESSGELLRFDEYMRRCLYDDGGFYATSGRAGQRRGDFITSPEVGPLFGEVVANAIDAWWHELGAPSDFTVFDVGCGPGALLRSVRRARPDRPWTLVGVDVAAAILADQRTTGTTGNAADGEIPVVAELPVQIDASIVLGNELLDNIPFRIVEQTSDGLKEVFVELSQVEGDRQASEKLLAFDREQGTDRSLNISNIAGVLAELDEGERAPVLSGAAEWVRSTLERGTTRLCLFDYGAASTAELARRGGWLRTYRQHDRGDDPYSDPGYWDITTDVAIDQLPAPTSVQTQTEFLYQWGISDLVEEGKAYWKANAHAPNVAAIKMRSRVSESEALVNPSGLGSWNVLHWSQI